jgi:hypothetical protein
MPGSVLGALRFSGLRPAKTQPGFPLQVLGLAFASPAGFPLQSLARPRAAGLGNRGKSGPRFPLPAGFFSGIFSRAQAGGFCIRHTA